MGAAGAQRRAAGGAVAPGQSTRRRERETNPARELPSAREELRGGWQRSPTRTHRARAPRPSRRLEAPHGTGVRLTRDRRRRRRRARAPAPRPDRLRSRQPASRPEAGRGAAHSGSTRARACVARGQTEREADASMVSGEHGCATAPDRAVRALFSCLICAEQVRRAGETGAGCRPPERPPALPRAPSPRLLLLSVSQLVRDLHHFRRSAATSLRGHPDVVVDRRQPQAGSDSEEKRELTRDKQRRGARDAWLLVAFLCSALLSCHIPGRGQPGWWRRVGSAARVLPSKCGLGPSRRCSYSAVCDSGARCTQRH